VTVERSQALMFVMNYAGSEDSSFLDGMCEANVVVLDMNKLENVNDATFKHLVKWTKLRRLLVNATDLSDEGLKYLKSVRSLSDIDACGTLIRGPGLSVLIDLPEIKHLNLARNAMRGCNFSQLPPLRKLTELDLSGSAISDEACVNLNRLTSIHYFNAAKNKITDVGISHLTGLINLNQINLMGTLVTPASAVSLAKLPRLNHVILADQQFSELGLIRFKKGLPKCYVERRVGTDKLDANMFAPLK
jgi:internalin A